MGSLRRLFLVLLVAAASMAFAAVKEPPRSALLLEPIATRATGLHGSQIVRSDQAGRVFLLLAERQAVYPVLKSGELGEPKQLETANSSLGYLLDAGLSPDGSQWLLLAEGKLRLFVEGKEKPLPPSSWQPWTVGFRRDTPIVGVMPRPLPSAVQHLQDFGAVPWLVALDNDRWSALVEHSGLSAETAWKERSRMNDWVAEYAAFLAAARDGKLWVANQYSYRLRRLSPTGRTLSDVTVEKKEKAAAAAKRMEAQGGKASFHAFTDEPVIAALVEGPAAVYLLVYSSGDSALALDRYDPALDRIDRVALPLEGSGRFTLASGKDGLYLAPLDSQEGLWRISWSALEAAAWKEVSTRPGGDG